MGSAVIRGVVGKLTWGYFNAAAINGYTVQRGTDGRWTLTATVVSADRFKLSQKPLVFVAPHQRGDWRWPVQDYELKDGALTAHLLPPLE